MDMQTQPNDMTPKQAAAALAWLVEMGADEIVLEQPVDRYAASVVVEEPMAQPPVAPQAVLRPATLPDQAAGDAASQAASCHSLEALSQALNYFEANPLRKGATKLSFIEGNLQSAILVLSDRPRNHAHRWPRDSRSPRAA